MQYMYILVLFLLYIEALFLNWMNSTVAVETGECPTNEILWMQRSANFCKDSQEYHCLPTLFLNTSEELCLKAQLIQPGFCVIYNPYLKTAFFDSSTGCIGKFNECPKESYQSNKIYLHPSCQKINPVEFCYLADSSCPNMTSDDRTDPSVSRNFTNTPRRGGISDAWNLSPLKLTVYGLVFLSSCKMWLY